MRRTSLHSSQSMVIFVINRVEPQQNRAIILFQQPFHEDPEQYDCVECAKICGDFAVAYFVDCIEIVGLHIICAQHAEDANSSLVLISIKHIFDAAKPKRGHSPRSYRTGTLKSRWRRLDYADAIVQLIHLGLPDQSTIITQRLAAFMPSWQKEDSDSAVQTSTIHFVQFLELPDDPKQYFNMHKLTFHPGRYHSESSLTDSRSTSNMELPASLTLDTRMTIINPVPDTVRTTYGTGMSQSGRAVIACVERDADMFAHFAFSMANIEGKNVKQCAPLVLPRITKGYSLDMEAYSGAVLYTNFPSEVVIRNSFGASVGLMSSSQRLHFLHSFDFASVILYTMSSHAIALPDLIDDVILRIIHECSAEDVLALERTCRSLRALLSEPNRPLWLSFLEGLDDFCAPDLPPNVPLELLSSDELKDLVSRATKGRKNWNSVSGPRVARRRVLNLRNTGLLGYLKQNLTERCEVIKIIPGGKFVSSLWSEGYIQCWDFENNECIWTYPQLGDFTDKKVVAFDAEYESSKNRLSFVIAATEREQRNNNESYVIEYLSVDPRSKTVLKEGRLSMRGTGKAPSLARFCGHSIILLLNSGILLTDRTLRRAVLLAKIRVEPDTVAVADDKLIFIGNDSVSGSLALYAIDAPGVLSLYRAQKRLARGPTGELRDAMIVTLSDLSRFVAKSPICLVGESIISVHISVCIPKWRRDSFTSIFSVVKLSESGRNLAGQQESTRFAVLKFLLPMSSPITQGFGPMRAPPTLILDRVGSPIAIPRSHPYCTDDVHLLSHSGRGVLASVNTLHKAVRYYAFSVERLLEGEIGAVPGAVFFGHERIAPGEVCMEVYSGALAFPSKDEQSLVIQFYD
ncbi:hypothetical protein EW145_g3813 [Phellinidium pouzarii]|uniref:F-box domain-containing protein n=1 Tax=Phellinidium pouzarii TaxID=167371 RepID=A0A4S4L607_9AGAM|nr:hypothetical protein EW145_g3813 [Phellinidium pouzarii]